MDLCVCESEDHENGVSVGVNVTLLSTIHTNRCRCNERLNTKTEGSELLGNTGFRGGRVHLKIETRLRGEMFEGVRGEKISEVYVLFIGYIRILVVYYESLKRA